MAHDYPLTEDERAKIYELRAKLIDAKFDSDIRYYTEEIHKILDIAEERVKSKNEQAATK